MPVLEIIPQAIKVGSNFVPQTAESTAVVQTTAQASLTIPALMPIGPALVPMPIIGMIISILMTKLQLIPAEIAQKIVSIIASLQAQYVKEYNAAVAKRSTAQTTLYNNLIKAQKKIKVTVADLTIEISELEKEIETLTEKYKTELAKYQATIIDYAAKAKVAKEKGDATTYQEYLDKISALDYWYSEIILMMTQVINDKVMLASDKVDLATYTPLAEKQIENDWNVDCEIASDFEVAIPYYPDLPDQPSYPTIPKFPEIPDELRTYILEFVKWLVCPMVPPIGVMIAAMLKQIKEKAPNTPVTAAQLDAQAEAMIPRLGGLV